MRIRIYYEYEGGIKKNVPRITYLHHEACRVLTNEDREGRVFLCHPHTNNISTAFSYFKVRLPVVPEYAEMQHDLMA